MSQRCTGCLAASLLLCVPAPAQGTPPAEPQAPPPPPAASDSPTQPDAGVTLLRLQVAGDQQNVQSEIKLALGGFMRVDYGYGNRFGQSSGRDVFGISKMSLTTTATYENFDFFARLGATVLSDQPAVDTAFKELYVVWHDVGGSGVKLTIGAQPLLFGLNSQGYAGDRSVVPSIEFGGAGGFAVSNQSATAIIGEYEPCQRCTLQAGLFDTSATTFGTPGVNVDGSRLYKNFFGQVRLGNLGIEGIEALAGAEGLYVGGSDDHIEPIFDVGAAYSGRRCRVSIEYMSIDQNVAATADRESYLVAEVTGYLDDRWTAFADYSVADRRDAGTIRVGAIHRINKHVDLQAEFALDSLSGTPDVESGNVRLTFHF